MMKRHPLAIACATALAATLTVAPAASAATITIPQPLVDLALRIPGSSDLLFQITNGSVQLLNAPGAPAPALTNQQLSDAQRSIFDKLNAERTSHGLAPVAWNEGLANDARAHSQWMASHNAFRHAVMRPGESENIFWTSANNPGGAAESWKNSPGHYANMMHPSAREVGIGFAPDGNGGWYATEKFWN
ncbi:CAP domain-containing protein [Corynebacterium glucuronolyticum]|uniref:CAP domain-containing protein n=2 Tax=Corynebacterium glucuronolyticum TaxID=39791 RepID=A0A7T4EHG7_9CORY|nr:CAP domain-containing protein [Corynebacterium glucuronolyticum]EEI26892.1 SCP-like protein [Corynebacterium glucuronolyticum ATCC 51867]EEI62172.1 SCP-like protein [Corynebacterium glucuronolyticum ATCC 51866]QQB47482.1 CAP domain-containing protein [Corynebacterium glucuronolyticum]QQU89137.1 CAP domain-containing protein [Corynebacterium glucuronolyticum]QRO82785.1 CAP domain-containing protein [Corynebacterium glucuronolyticum]